jgi:hypothetical protein
VPSKSKEQHNLMAMVAHDPKAAKRLGIPQSVGRDYVEADKGRKFGDSKMMKKDMADKMGRALKKKGAAGRAMMKYAEGGSVYRKGADGITAKGKTKGKMVKMAYGGKC